MRVRELVQRKSASVVTVSPGTPLKTAARLMMERGIGGLPVVDLNDEVVGFLSERDVVKAVDAVQGSVADLPTERVMRRPPVCGADTTVTELMASMTVERERHFVVMDRNRLIGVLSVGDLVKHRLDQLEVETGVLRDYVAAQRAAP